MIVTWVSKKGGREINEDAVAKSRKKGITCVVVADGLGGHRGGETASDIAAEEIISIFNNEPGFSKEHIDRYIRHANEKIVGRAVTDPELVHMSSTVAVLLIKGRNAIWANVGDSRIYRLTDGIISEVSEDHSVAFLDFANGDIEYGDIRTNGNRNKLTSALGIAMDGINISEPMQINTRTSFVLCTDGWWEYVTEDDMENTFKASADAKEWFEKMLEIREQNAPSDSDNFTAVVVAV